MLARLGLCLATAVIALATVQSTSAAGPRYRATILRSTYAATVAYAQPHSINDNGLISGVDQMNGDSMGMRATLWDSTGAPTLLSVPQTATFSVARGINNAGVVVGHYGFPGTTQGSVWASPTERSNFTGGTPLLINNKGSILTASALYRSGVITSVPSGSGYGLSDNDVVVGVSHASLRPAARLLPTYASFGSESGLFTSVNDHGQMIGRIGRSIVRVEQDGTTQIFATAPSTDFSYTYKYQTTDINDRGIFVGWTGTPPPPGTYPVESTIRASIFQDGAATDLSTLIDGPGTWITRKAYDINNRGQIVGYGVYDADGNGPIVERREAFLLDPIRKPGDTNYDNVVNFADLVTLAQNYNRAGNGLVFYETGDFNYDWKVDFADLVTLAQNYNGGSGNAASMSGAFAADWALAQSLVPEPAAVSAIVAAGIAMARRRRC